MAVTHTFGTAPFELVMPVISRVVVLYQTAFDSCGASALWRVVMYQELLFS